MEGITSTTIVVNVRGVAGRGILRHHHRRGGKGGGDMGKRMIRNTCYAWAGGTFFPVVLLCQLFVLSGNRFWFYILLMYLEYHTVVVLC